jgi:hypothetical protein
MERHRDRTDIVRVLSLTLPELQWRALLEVEPEPIAWLRQQIRERLQEQGLAGESESTTGQGICASGGMS